MSVCIILPEFFKNGKKPKKLYHLNAPIHKSSERRESRWSRSRKDRKADGKVNGSERERERAINITIGNIENLLYVFFCRILRFQRNFEWALKSMEFQKSQDFLKKGHATEKGHSRERWSTDLLILIMWLITSSVSNGLWWRLFYKRVAKGEK